jgi:hypothetical protein
LVGHKEGVIRAVVGLKEGVVGAVGERKERIGGIAGVRIWRRVENAEDGRGRPRELQGVYV